MSTSVVHDQAKGREVPTHTVEMDRILASRIRSRAGDAGEGFVGRVCRDGGIGAGDRGEPVFVVGLGGLEGKDEVVLVRDSHRVRSWERAVDSIALSVAAGVKHNPAPGPGSVALPR